MKRRTGPAVYWSEWRILDAAELWNERYGQPPKADNWTYASEDFPSTCTVRYHFGTWGNMIEAAGFPPTRPGMPVYWTPEKIAAGIQLFHAANGRVPHIRELCRSSATLPHWQTILKVCGSLRGACELAGLECPRAGVPAVWTRDMIAAAMLDHVLGTGKWPTVREWQRAKNGAARPTYGTVLARFGTWAAAKKYAGWLTPAQVERAEATRLRRNARTAEQRRLRRNELAAQRPRPSSAGPRRALAGGGQLSNNRRVAA